MISCPEPKLIRSQKTCGGRERGERGGFGGVQRKDRGAWEEEGQLGTGCRSGGEEEDDDGSTGRQGQTDEEREEEGVEEGDEEAGRG